MPARSQFKFFTVLGVVSRSVFVLSAVLAAVSIAAPAAQSQTLPGSTSPEAAARVVAIAQQELARGVFEKPKGSNRGTRIRMYGLATQASLRYYPAPWCAYFASWVTRQAGVPIGWNGLGDGYVPRISAWAKKVGIWKKTPQPGDLIAFPQHIGIVESLQPNGTVTTIEGNTSDGLRRRLRLIKSASGFVRVSYLTAPVAEITVAADPVIRDVPVLLTATNIAKPARAIKSYRWDIDGDGTWDKTSSKPQLTLSFPENGNFPVTVSISDSHHVAATTTVNIRVVNGSSGSGGLSPR